jgi:hypothetical protein
MSEHSSDTSHAVAGVALGGAVGALGIALGTALPLVGFWLFIMITKLALVVAGGSAALAAYFARETEEPGPRVVWAIVAILAVSVFSYAVWKALFTIPAWAIGGIVIAIVIGIVLIAVAKPEAHT